MNDTLDRLKALNSKLEEKLSQKKALQTTGKREEGEKKRTTSSPKKREEPRTKGPSKEQAHSESEETLSRGKSLDHEIPLLHRKLLMHLGIDSAAEPVRSENLRRLVTLYLKLDIAKKVSDIEDIFIYKAMNISGIGLKEEDFGEVREGKYVQVIAITYEPDKNGKKKAKNISLGYFGKAETLDTVRKNEVIEFVLRWRYEKAFQNLEHYRHLLDRVRPKETLF
ncbi:hypothetical protein [Nitratifractor sp.]